MKLIKTFRNIDAPSPKSHFSKQQRIYSFVTSFGRDLSSLKGKLLFLFCCFFFQLTAQDLQVSFSVPIQGSDNFSVCGSPKTVSLEIENISSDTLTNITASIPLLTGFNYLTGSVAGAATVQNASIPSFSIDTLFPNVTRSFSFQAFVNCGGITEINLGGNKNLTANFTYTGGTGTFSQTSANFDLVKPTLAIPNSTPNTLNLAFNETATITTTLSNTSVGTLDSLTFFIKKTSELDLLSVSINGNNLTAFNTSGDTLFYAISGSLMAAAMNMGNNGNANLMEQNESFSIAETYRMNDCNATPADLERGASYGCDGQICETTSAATSLTLNDLDESISNDTTICRETSINVVAAGGLNYLWKELDGPAGNITNANLGTNSTLATGTADNAKTYRVIISAGNCIDSLETTVSRFVPIPISAGRDKSSCVGAVLSLSTQAGFSNYSWQALSGGAPLTGQTVGVSPTETTEYELSANDANGCLVKDTVKVIILEASNFNINITVPQAGVDKFSVCGPPKTINVAIENLINDTISDLHAAVNLLNGFFYIPNSLSAGVSLVNSNPVFSIDTLFPSQILNFSFDLGVNCDGIATANSPGNKNLSLTFSCSSGGDPIFTETSDNFELAKATLTIPSSTPSELEMYLNKIDTVTSRIVNGSQGELDSLEFFILDHANLTIVDVLINGISIPVDRQEGGRTYFVLDGAIIAEARDVLNSNNDPNLFEFNEFFDIKEVYQMTTCNAQPARLERGANYGCDGQVCEEVTRQSNVSYGVEAPSLNFQPYTGFSTDMNPLCYNDAVITSGFYFTNNGQAPATNINFRLDDYAPHGGSATTGFDQNSVTWQTGANGTAQALTPASVGANNCSGFPNDLRFNLNNFILAPGDTIFVKFDRYTGCGCNQATNRGCQVRNVNSWRILGQNTNRPQFTDLCGFNTFNANQYNFSGERVSLTTFLEAPIQIGSGEQASNTYNIPFYANSIDEDCPTCYIEATYAIGNGLDVTGLMWIDNNGNMWTPDFYDYSDNGISGGGGSTDSLTVRWIGTPPGGFSPSGGGSAILLKYESDCDETGMMCAQGAVANIRQEIRYYMPPCSNCSPQLITCPVDNSVEIECPSCDPCNGLEHTVMEVQRATIGLGDNDDDGIPESGEFIDTSMIRLDRIIRGDTVKVTYKGHINGVDSFTFAYATLDMAISDYLPLGAEVTIYDVDLDTFYVCNVVQQFKDGNNLVNNLSVASLNGLGCATLPTDFHYAPGDSISLNFYFRVLQNVGAGIHNQTLTSRFFVSDEAYGGMMFRCNDLSDNIYQVGLYETFFIQGSFNQGGCNTFSHEWEQRSWLGSSSDAAYDYFPNEYRKNWRFPKLHTVTKPNLDLLNFQIFVRNKRGTTIFNQTVSANSPYVLVNGADYTLNVEQFILDNGGIPDLDEGARFEIRSRLRGGCATTVGNYPLAYKIDWDLDPNFFGQATDTTSGSNTLSYTGGPQVSVQSNQSLIELSGENACFEITISNSVNNNASNSFLQFQSNSGAIVLQSIREITAGSDSSYLNPNTDIYQLGDLNGNAQKRFEVCVITNSCSVDSLIINTGWSCSGYPATFQEAECVSNDVVKVSPIEAELGMSVLQPTATIMGNLCTPTTYELELTSGKLGYLNNIHLQFFLPPNMDYIPGSFELAYPIPLMGAPTFNVVADPVNIYGNVYQINISDQHPILDTVGLVGTTNLVENLLRVRFQTTTDCGYTSGSKLRFLSYAYDACGKLTNYRFSPAESVEVIGVSAPFISDVGAGDLEINPCLDESVPLNINLTVGSLSPPIGPNDSIRIILPYGLEYVPNSYQNVQNSVNTQPQIDTVNDEQIVYFDLVDGLSPGQRAEFTFNVKAKVLGQQCIDHKMIIQSFSSAQVQCQSTGQFCTVRAASDEFSRSVTYIVPSLEFTNFEVASVINGTNETFTSSVTLLNNSNVSIPNGTSTQIDIYADIDNNGKFSTPDSLLGSISTTEGIPALTSKTITGNFTIPASIYCNLIAVSDNKNNCSCPTSYSLLQKANTSYVFDKDHTVCSGDTIQVGPTAIAGFTYEWLSVNGSNINAIQNVNAAQSNVSFVNVSGSNLDWKFALRTIKDGNCYSFDTIDVTIYPQRNDMITTQGCSGFPISLSGPTDGSNYQWMPTTGLVNANSPSTLINNFSGSATYNLTYTDPNGCTAYFEQSITEGACAAQTALGNYVWLDANRDGVQDPSENGIPNLQVFLYNSNNLSTPIASTLTDFSGKYLFNPLPAGEYVIGFASPGSSYAPTKSNVGSNDLVDSDMDTTTLRTTAYLIANGDEVLTVDAGFIQYNCAVSVPSGIERICLGNSLTLGAAVTGDINNFHWADANNIAANPEAASSSLSDINSLSPVFTPNHTGIYTFYFIGNNNNPSFCSDTATLSVLVEGAANPVITSADTVLCQGDSMTLYGTGGTTLEWFENGVSVGTGASLVIQPNANATYRLQATTDFGCTANIEQNITVLPPISVANIADQSICNGQSATIAAANGYTSYQWKSIPNGAAFAGATIIVNPSNTTNYALTVQDTNGCIGRDTVQITVNTLPVPAFSINSSCGLNPITFNNNSTNATTYEWDFGDGSATSTSTNPTHTYSAPGTYTVKLKAGNANTCMDSIFQQINVGTITASLTATQLICNGDSATLMATGGTSYVWKQIAALGGTILNQNIGTNTSLNTGSLSDTAFYRVIIDNGTCADSLETAVQVAPSQTISTSGDNTICQNESTTIRAASGFSNYTWTAQPSGISYAGDSIIISPMDTTTYVLTATDANGCTATGSFTLNVRPIPTAGFTVSGDCQLNPINFTSTSAISSGSITNYSWNFGDGSGTSTNQNPNYTYVNAGTYTVSLTVFSNHNCTDTYTQTINVGGLTTFITPATTICTGSHVDLTATGGSNYLWKQLDAPNGNITNPNLSNLSVYNTGNLSANTHYRVIISNANCIDSLETSVLMAPANSVNAGIDQSICLGDTTSLLAQFGFSNYKWVANPGGTVLEGRNVSIMPTVTTDYILTAADGNGCELRDTVRVNVNPKPQVNFSSAGNCVLNAVTFTNNSSIASGTISSYQWDFGDGSGTSTQTSPSYTFNAKGTYSVKLIATSNTGCTDSLIQSISIDSIQLSINASDSICAGETVTLSASGGTTYLWKQLDGPGGNITNASLSSLSNFTVTPSTTTTYRALIQNANCIDSLETTFSIRPSNSINAGTDQSICIGESATLSAATGYSNYQWQSLVDGATYAGQNIIVQPDTTTRYTLQANDGNACTVIDTIQISVNPKPKPAFSLSGNCNLNPVSFTNNSTGSTTYMWNFGDGTSSTATNPTHTFANAGTYNVQLIATNGFGCVDSITQQVMIGSLPITISPNQTICPNETATLTAAGGNTYIWKQLDAPNGNIINANLSNQASLQTNALTTTSTFRVVVSDPNCSDSLETTISIHSPLSINAGVDQNICAGETASLSASMAFSNYEWKNLSNGLIYKGKDISLMPTTTTQYALQANDANGCLVHDTVQISVHPIPNVDFTSTGNCVLNPVVFSNNSTINSGTIANYNWDFGDGTGTSTQENPSYTYSTVGTYMVKLRIISNQGCQDSLTKQIIIDTIAPSLTASHSICPNTHTNLVATGANTYVWKLLDGPNGNIINPNLSTLGVYNTGNLTDTTTYRVIFDNNKCLDSLETTISIFNPTALNAGNDQSICMGESINLIAPVGFSNYEWRNLNTGAVFSQQSANVQPDTTSLFELVANDVNGCMVRDTLQINVNPAPTPSFTVMGSCGLNPVNFTSTSTIATGSITDYIWDLGDGTTANGTANTSHTYPTAGTYTVTLVVESNTGCKDSITQQITVGSLPITISPNQSICPNESTTLQASGGTTYLWKILDGPNGNITNANAHNQPTFNTPALSSTTTFRVVVSDPNCTDSLETTVTVHTPATLNAGADETICAGETANLNAPTGFTNYQWKNLNTGNSSAGQNIQIQPLTTTSYALQANDPNGCLVFDTLMVTVHPQPVPNFTSSGTCLLNPVNFTSTSSIATGSITAYAWDFGDGSGTSTQQNPNYTYSNAGTYTVKLVIQSNQNCRDSISKNITIHNISPVLTASHAICPNTTTTLVATGADNYIWKQLDAPNGNITNANISTASTFTTPNLTTNTAYRVIFDNGNCIDSLETTVSLHTPATLNAGADDTICVGQIATISAQAGFTNYQWVSIPGGATYTGQNIQVSPNNTTLYALQANDSNGCLVHDTLQIVVHPNPIADFGVTGSCGLNAIHFSDSSSISAGTIDSYLWTFGDGTGTSTLQNPSYTYSSTGTFTVKLIITSNQNCQDSISKTITVGSLPITISPNQSICPNESATLQASGGTTYLWKILD